MPDRASLLLDANILLLLVVGRIDQRLIDRYKRTANRFVAADYLLLVRFAGRFNRIYTTPHILTEVSNLLTGFHDPYRREAREVLGRLIEELIEVLPEARDIVQSPEYAHLGLTDTAIITVVKTDIVVLTDDVALMNALYAIHYPVINFNHLRDVG